MKKIESKIKNLEDKFFEVINEMHKRLLIMENKNKEIEKFIGMKGAENMWNEYPHFSLLKAYFKFDFFIHQILSHLYEKSDNFKEEFTKNSVKFVQIWGGEQAAAELTTLLKMSPENGCKEQLKQKIKEAIKKHMGNQDDTN